MSKTEFMSKLADVLQIDVTEIAEDMMFNADNWDSFAQLGAISAIDEIYGFTVPSNELKDCGTVGDLLRLIERTLTSA
jgi:acyl carrier protein